MRGTVDASSRSSLRAFKPVTAQLGERARSGDKILKRVRPGVLFAISHEYLASDSET